MSKRQEGRKPRPPMPRPQPPRPEQDPSIISTIKKGGDEPSIQHPATPQIKRQEADKEH